MRNVVPFSNDFMEGFVTECQRQGHDLNSTQDLFQKFAASCFISQPEVYTGFSSCLASYDGELTKAAMSKYLTPDMIALVLSTRIKYASDLSSVQMRESLGLPEPSWDTVPDSVKAAASNLSTVLDGFDQLPLNQKVLLASLAGGGIGATARSLVPTGEDQLEQRGVFSRATRGALRGAGVGAGAAAGAAAGSNVGGMVNRDFRLPAMAFGSVLGGLAGNRLTTDFVT